MTNNSSQFEQAKQLLQVSIDQSKIEVPVLPETVHRVMGLIQDPDSDAAQLANIIQTDPTLGGHVMRIANSAAYSPNSNLVSIQQAIARLGMTEISNIAFSTSLNSKLFHAPGYEKHIAKIWQQALASALWAKEISRTMRSNVESAFLCGLLHTIGQPVVLQTLAEVTEDKNPMSNECILSLFADFEMPYSKKVCEEWRMPNIVTETITHYKNYAQAPNESQLAAIIAFAHELADFMLHPQENDIEQVKDSDTLDILNLYPDEVEKLLAKEAAIKTSMNTMSAR